MPQWKTHITYASTALCASRHAPTALDYHLAAHDLSYPMLSPLPLLAATSCHAATGHQCRARAAALAHALIPTLAHDLVDAATAVLPLVSLSRFLRPPSAMAAAAPPWPPSPQATRRHLASLPPCLASTSPPRCIATLLTRSPTLAHAGALNVVTMAAMAMVPWTLPSSPPSLCHPPQPSRTPLACPPDHSHPSTCASRDPHGQNLTEHRRRLMPSSSLL